MKAPLRLHVFHGQRKLFFIAENRFVLRAVIFKGAAYIRHERNEGDIGYKDGYFHDALDDPLENAEVPARELFYS